MKVIVQIIEAWIWISIVIGVGAVITKIFQETSIMDYIEGIFVQLWDLLWWEITTLFYSVFLWCILIYIGRWAISWSSSNWWQTANNKWN